MARRRPSRLVGPAFAAGLCGALWPFAVMAQTDGPAVITPPAETAAPPILTLNQDRLYRDSAFGRAALARAEAEAADLSAENRRLEAALEAEERALTDRRAALSPEDFAPLAAAFDQKVEEIRAAQDAKSRAITRQLDDDRKRFFETALPVLGELLNDTGAVAILADSAIILSLSSLDITDEAIARIDLVLTAPDPAPPAPAPDAPVAPDAPGEPAPAP